MFRPALPLVRLVPIVALCVGLLSSAAVAQETDTSPSPGTDVATQGADLVDRFLTILSAENGDEKRAEMEAFLSAEFQLVGADGSRLDRQTFIDAPSTITEFAVHDLIVTGGDGIVVASYMLEATVMIEAATRTGTAPRLSVFHQEGEEWRLAAHANFLPLDPEPAASPSASPAA